MKIADTPMAPLLALQKGIFIAGMEKPKCCFDCHFLTKPETIHQFFEFEGKRKQYFEHVYNCTLIPEDEEDGWHDLEWAMENVQPWCPIVEMKINGISVENLMKPDRDNYSFSFSETKQEPSMEDET